MPIVLKSEFYNPLFTHPESYSVKNLIKSRKQTINHNIYSTKNILMNNQPSKGQMEEDSQQANVVAEQVSSPHQPIPNNAAQQSKSQSLIEKMENKTRVLCESLSHLTGTLRTSMHAISAITLSHMQIYETSMNNMCKAFEDNVNEMTGYVEKCKELNQNLHDMRKLYDEM